MSGKAASATTTTTTTTTTEQIWRDLTAWIRQHGGVVHEALELRQEEEDSSSSSSRGVYSTQPIAAGVVLMRIPHRLTLHGRNFASTYYYPASQLVVVEGADEDEKNKAAPKKASPWLRCLAAYYQAQQQQQSSSTDAASSNGYSSRIDFQPYLQSLPDRYETVAAWSDDEINSYLAGTCTQGGSAVSWHTNGDDAYWRQRYREQIRPYLTATGVIPQPGESDDVNISALQAFQTATACLSTRAFHLQKEDESATDDNTKLPSTKDGAHDDDDDDNYTGPFLLPGIDLLNHATSTEVGHVCSLHRTADNHFVVVAESAITAHQEILHSYGDALTASQCFQTFGFVSHERMARIVQYYRQTHQATASRQRSIPLDATFTPALLRKQDVLETCWQVIDSDLPARLAVRMADMEEEVWPVKVDRSRTADFICEDLIVSGGSTSGGGDDDDDHDGPTTVLTNEIVTCAVLAFLPPCAYREAAQALLGVEILDDFFLGNLVCTSLLRVIQAKMATYRPLTWQGQEYTDDVALLEHCLQSSQTSIPTSGLSQMRLQYGLTIRLEEKACLQALRQNVIDTLARLEESVPENHTDDEMHVDKKQKTQE